MNKAFEDHLYRCWPGIFRGRNRPPTETSIVHGCTHGDGWYAILDALCEVLTAHANEFGRLPPEAKQVKEKLAGLRFYVGDPCDEFDEAAISMAEALSLRICEITGRPGRNSCRAGNGFATLSPHVACQRGFAVTKTDGGRPMPPVPDAARVLAAKWPQVVLRTIDLPGGWYDVADILLERLAGQWVDEKTRLARDIELGGKNERLIVRLDGAGLRERGTAAFATAVSARIDQASGAARI